MHKVLIVEDEASIRHFMAIGLKREGFGVMEAGSAEDGLRMLEETPADMVLLDVSLPGMDGFACLEQIRGQWPELAVIMVTARGQDMDRIMGLELGADDYVVKPFNPLELAARIRSVLRRMQQIQPKSGHQFGNLRIDEKGHSLTRAGVAVDLTPKEFQLVLILSKHPGTAFDRQTLLEKVWEPNFYGDPKTLDVHIRRIREKIEENPSEPKFVETVWGVGYRWVPEPDKGV